MWIVVAAIFGALAVVLGAFGAHGLEHSADPDQVGAWRTASQYHLLHSVALLALGLYAARSERSIRTPAALFSAGIVLFSGSIYGLVLTGATWLGPITPLGGVCMLAGWLSLPALLREGSR
jgi:uncharacterized membrane protein YgdD (TMEM256/DUF423 family)